jgi:hypothetical protein
MLFGAACACRPCCRGTPTTAAVGMAVTSAAMVRIAAVGMAVLVAAMVVSVAVRRAVELCERSAFLAAWRIQLPLAAAAACMVLVDAAAALRVVVPPAVVLLVPLAADQVLRVDRRGAGAKHDLCSQHDSRNAMTQ